MNIITNVIKVTDTLGAYLISFNSDSMQHSGFSVLCSDNMWQTPRVEGTVIYIYNIILHY